MGKHRAKIKLDTICNFNDGGLRSMERSKNINASKFSWVRRIYCNVFHEWKVIPLKYI